MQKLKLQFVDLCSYLQNTPAVWIILETLVALVCLKGISLLVRRFTAQRVSAQAAMLCEKAIWYGGVLVVVATSLSHLGVDLGPILGAAGIAGIAVGFASQSSLSNIIGGLFLVTEKPFEVGDIIRIGSTLGSVLSIDLLSVKIRTLDNQFVRIPNESVIKAEVTTITRFPIRRMDIDLEVAYKEDLARVVDILKDVAMQNPAALDEPDPLVIVKSFGDSGVHILFGVWFNKPDYLAVKNSMMIEVKARFDAEGIEIPFPHRTVYAGTGGFNLREQVAPETKTG